MRRLRSRARPASPGARGSGGGFGFSASKQSATKRRPMYLSPAIVSPCVIDRVGVDAHRRAARVGPVEAGDAAVRLQLDPAVLDRHLVELDQPAQQRQRERGLVEAGAGDDAADVEPARVLARACSITWTRRPSGPGLISSISPMICSKRPSSRPVAILASQPRRCGAVPFRIRPRNSIRWSKSRSWNASIPSASKKQRGVFRSCSSGVGLRTSEMHFAPTSIAFAHSLTDAIPEPMTM